MRAAIITLGLAGLLGACAHGSRPAIDLSSAGAPPAGAAYRFASRGVGQRPGDFLVRSQVEAGLAARGFRRSDEQPRYVVEVAVTARPPNVGAFTGPPGPSPAWLVAPVARGAGGKDHVCAVGFRFVDAATGAEVWRVRAQQHGPVEDCNTENFRLADAALERLSAAR